MKQTQIKESLTEILQFISLAEIARRYYGKSRQWLYFKLNNSTVNGVKYQFDESEIQALISALSDIKKESSKSIKNLEQSKQTHKKSKGSYFTHHNPFDTPLFFEWLKIIPDYSNRSYLEPFAGQNHIVKLIQEIAPSIKVWSCYDIQQPNNIHADFRIIKRDTIRNFPKGYDVVITNPPFLAKNSAKRRHIDFPQTEYDDLYKLCLDKILNNSKYSAVIVPESFITANLFHDRLYGVVSLTHKMFSDTNCPVCLALFIPKKSDDDFKVYIGSEYAGKYHTLKEHDLTEYSNLHQWIFNAPDGNIGVKCVDSAQGADIEFVSGDMISADTIKVSSRTFTRISGLPESVDTRAFIQRCNEVLAEYRELTKDIFMTSFKGLRKDGKYRRRIDFTSLRYIMNKIYEEE